MNKILFRLLHEIIGLLAFFKTLLKAPLAMGMICPSSSFLTKKLANQIPDSLILKLKKQQHTDYKINLESGEKYGYVVELGAGTGAVTKALLQRGVPPTKLIVFEQSATMASLLTQRFPGICIIQDDAANMAKYLPKNGYIASIVSSLPFVSLPEAVSENIIGTIQEMIGESFLIQYTYALNQKTLLEKKGFVINEKSTVWVNLPPAHVISYTYTPPRK